jgi:beta-fructofuranosidase
MTSRTLAIAAVAAVAAAIASAAEPAAAAAAAAASDPFFPTFHVRPAANWINDPNGPMYFNGVTHLFMQ